MTHTQLLLKHLREYGPTPYGDLLARYGARYGARGYTYNGFATAAARLREQKRIVGPSGHGQPLALASICPCCGQTLPGQCR